jgi:protein phosphatase
MNNRELHLEWSGETDRGKVRSNNEDSFLAVRLDQEEVQWLGKVGESPLNSSQFVFAVSDGMGGAMAGEYASRIAVEKIARMSARWQGYSPHQLAEKSPDLLNTLFAEIHRALRYLGTSYEECAGMEATLTLCWFTPNQLFHAHLGDSRLYHLPSGTGKIRQLTEDDTHVAWLYRTGQINEREARNHPRRRVLQKALGGGNQFVTPQVGSVQYKPGDRFLLCTDGVVEELYDHEIQEALLDSKAARTEAASRLIRAVLTKEARDNATAMVIDVLGPGLVSPSHSE